jgi:hypothetical protein
MAVRTPCLISKSGREPSAKSSNGYGIDDAGVQISPPELGCSKACGRMSVASEPVRKDWVQTRGAPARGLLGGGVGRGVGDPDEEGAFPVDDFTAYGQPVPIEPPPS